MSAQYVSQIKATAPVCLDPQVRSVRKTPGYVQIEVLVPADLAYFQGHFPAEPILPGVVQILWVQRFVQRWLEPGKIFVNMDRVKFKSVIRPGDELTLDVRSIPAGVSYLYRRAGQVVGSGHLTCDADAPST